MTCSWRCIRRESLTASSKESHDTQYPSQFTLFFSQAQSLTSSLFIDRSPHAFHIEIFGAHLVARVRSGSPARQNRFSYEPFVYQIYHLPIYDVRRVLAVPCMQGPKGREPYNKSFPLVVSVGSAVIMLYTVATYTYIIKFVDLIQRHEHQVILL